MPSLTRRNFLRLITVLGITPLLPKWKPLYAQGSNEADVIVIGAGMAGIGAARSLVDEGYSVIILEARNRIGGRIWTDDSMDGIPLDMGASWIHGPDGNPLTELADEYGIERVTTENGSVYALDGEELDDAAFETLEALYQEFMELLAEAQAEDSEAGSLAELVDRLLAEENYTEEEVILLRSALVAEIVEDYAADLDDLSAHYWDVGDGFDGQDVIFPEGYVQIPRAVAQGLDIRLEQVVTKIEYDETGVVVTTDQGEFEAYYAIVTVPLGVLQHGSITFDPPLPSRKQQAIDRLYMGLLNKVYLRFDKLFWKAEDDGFDYIAQRWVEWASFYPALGEPILLAFIGGRTAQAYEAKSDETIIADVMEVLRTIFGEAIPQPLDYRITRWGQDPYAFGSYSAQGVEATPDDIEALAEPVEAVLFFAGEATSYDYSATVHGALMSGRDAADALMEIDELWEAEQSDDE